MKRNDARSVLLGKARRGRFEIVKLVLKNDDGTTDELEVEVRAPTYGQRQRIFAAAPKDASDVVLGLAAGLEAAITCTFVDGQPLFEEGDRKTLLDSTVGAQVVQQISTVAMRLVKETPSEAIAEKN